MNRRGREGTSIKGGKTSLEIPDRLPVLSLPAPPGSRRVPSPTTVDFVLEDSTPDSISEVSCLSEASPWGTGGIHTFVKRLGLAGALHGFS